MDNDAKGNEYLDILQAERNQRNLKIQACTLYEKKRKYA